MGHVKAHVIREQINVRTDASTKYYPYKRSPTLSRQRDTEMSDWAIQFTKWDTDRDGNRSAKKNAMGDAPRLPSSPHVIGHWVPDQQLFGLWVHICIFFLNQAWFLKPSSNNYMRTGCTKAWRCVCSDY